MAAHTLITSRRRQPLPTVGKVYAQEGEKPCSSVLASEVPSEHLADFPHLFPQTGENLPAQNFALQNQKVSGTEAGIPALPVRRLCTAFYAAGHLLPIDFADRAALLEQRERILDLAEALLDLADAMDAPLEDREPEPVEAEDDEATQQPVTLAPDWLRTKNGRRAEARHGGAGQSSGQVGHLKVLHRATPLQAFRAPGELLPQKGERA